MQLSTWSVILTFIADEPTHGNYPRSFNFDPDGLKSTGHYHWGIQFVWPVNRLRYQTLVRSTIAAVGAKTIESATVLALYRELTSLS